MKSNFTLVCILFLATVVFGQDPNVTGTTFNTTPIEVGQNATYSFNGNNFNANPIDASMAQQGFCVQIDFGNGTYDVSPQDASALTVTTGDASEWDVTYTRINGHDQITACLTGDLGGFETFAFDVNVVGVTVTSDPLSPITQTNIVFVDGQHGLTASTDVFGNNDQTTALQVIAASPTPVELVSFDAEARGNVSVLTWETSSELNNEGFYVERSKDGKRFETLGFVKGNGTASISNTYEFIDETPNEDNYYRLRQVDYDGSEEYSDIEFVRFITNVSASVYPNPFVDRLTISTGAYAGPIAVSIIDANGRLISNEVTSDRNKDLSDLKAGVYFLYVRNEEGVELLKEKVIKVK